MIERWRDVVGWEGLYQVSDQGRVRSRRRRTKSGWRGGKVLSPIVKRQGYCRVNLQNAREGRRKLRYVHQLVLEAFVGPCPTGQEVRHLNDEKCDNRLENLAYGYRTQNEADKALNRPEGTPGFRIPDEVVEEAAKLHKLGATWDQIGAWLGRSPNSLRTRVYRLRMDE